MMRKSIQDQTISLPIKSLNIETIPRLFKITTNNSSGSFNINILAKTSSIISQLIKENPNNLQYHIDIQDDSNIISKLENIYIGKSVKFSKNDFLILMKIAEKLDLVDLFNIFGKSENRLYHGFDTIRFNIEKENSRIRMEQYTLNNFLMSQSNNKFTIKTKKNEYKCNIFGVLFSSIISEILLKDPRVDSYFYDYEDEDFEFKEICDIFNFKTIKLNKNNASIIRDVVEDLKIHIIQDTVNKYVDENEKISEALDDQQEIIDSIGELFDSLYHIKEKTVDDVLAFIKESRWSKSEENVYDLASFILQIVRTDIKLHQYMIELLLKLDENGDKTNKLKSLLPFINDHLISIFSSNRVKECSSENIYPFIYNLYKRGIIPKEKIENIIKNCDQYNPVFIQWFLPELAEMNIYCTKCDFKYNIIQFKTKNPLGMQFFNYGSTNLEEYKLIRDKGECNDDAAMVLRQDDVDSFQSIISKNPDALLKNKIEKNIFENVTDKTRYLNYAASCGSIKCFKYLLLNNEDIDESTFEMAIIGGNNEIIRIVSNKQLSHNSIIKALMCSIKMHKYDLFDWILEQNYSKINQEQILNAINCSIINGNAHALVTLIDNGVNFNNYTSNYSNFIRSSSMNGYYLFTIFLIKLIKKNCDTPIKISPDSTVSFGNIYIFDLFLDKMDNTEIVEILTYASKNQIMNVIKHYFEKIYKPGINFVSNDAIYLLCKCLQLNLNEVLDYLIEKVNILKILNVGSLFRLVTDSINSDNIEKAKHISQLIYNYNSKFDFTKYFQRCISLNQIEMIKFYIDNKYYVNYDIIEAKSIDIKETSIELFVLIMDNASFTFKQNVMLNSIDKAIKDKNIPIVKYLLDNDVPIDNALIEAIKTDDIELVNLVLNKNSEPSYINKCNALMAAIDINNMDIIERLLSIQGINPSISDKFNKTPLVLAVEKNKDKIVNKIFDFYGDKIKNEKVQLEMVLKIIMHNYTTSKPWMRRYLIKIIKLNCIDPNLRFDDNTLLTFACGRDISELYKELIQFDTIDVNLCIPKNGDTPLLLAIRNENYELCKLLINHPQININQKNYEGYSPLICAVRKNNNKKCDEIVDLLLKNDKINFEESDINLAFYLSSYKYSNKLILASTKLIDVNYIPFNSKDISYTKANGQKVILTSLSKSIMDSNIELFDMIIQHPTFIKDKNNLIKDIYVAVLKNKCEMLTKLFDLVEEFDIDINSPIFDGRNILIDNIINEASDELLSCVLLMPKFDSKKSDILKAFTFLYDMKALNSEYPSTKSNTKSKNMTLLLNKIDLIYKYDSQHDHLIDDEIAKEGDSFYKSMYSKLFEETNAFNINVFGQFVYPLQYAIRIDSNILFYCLINFGKVDFNMQINEVRHKKTTFCSYLHIAASLGRLNMLKEMISRHLIDVNKVNVYGETPLMDACLNCHIECVKYLFTLDDLDYLHKNNDNEDALEMLRKLVNKDQKSTEIKEIKNKDEYLAELLELINKKQSMINEKTIDFNKKTKTPKTKKLNNLPNFMMPQQLPKEVKSTVTNDEHFKMSQSFSDFVSKSNKTKAAAKTKGQIKFQFSNDTSKSSNKTKTAVKINGPLETKTPYKFSNFVSQSSNKTKTAMQINGTLEFKMPHQFSNDISKSSNKTTVKKKIDKSNIVQMPQKCPDSMVKLSDNAMLKTDEPTKFQMQKQTANVMSELLDRTKSTMNENELKMPQQNSNTKEDLSESSTKIGSSIGSPKTKQYSSTKEDSSESSAKIGSSIGSPKPKQYSNAKEDLSESSDKTESSTKDADNSSELKNQSKFSFNVKEKTFRNKQSYQSKENATCSQDSFILRGASNQNQFEWQLNKEIEKENPTSIERTQTTNKNLPKIHFDTYNESFSEKPDPSLQNLLSNLKQKKQDDFVDRKINAVDDDEARNVSKMRNRHGIEENLFDDEDELNQLSYYQQQQIINQNQMMFLQQQKWYEMIQMNNELQTRINMQMMIPYKQIKQKKHQKSKKKKNHTSKS